MWYAGRRPVWKLVGSLSLTERQQWECTLLRSTSIKRHAETTDVMNDRVFKVFEDDVRRVRRTATFDEDDALATVQRRHTLWRCARTLGTDSAQQITSLYEQLTTKPITRQAVAQQLGKVRRPGQKQNEILTKLANDLERDHVFSWDHWSQDCSRHASPLRTRTGSRFADNPTHNRSK